MEGRIASLTFNSVGDNEHGFSLRWRAAQAGGVIQAMVAKSVLEVAPTSATVSFAPIISQRVSNSRL